MIDVYYGLTEEGRDRSFIKWTFAVLCVVALAICILAGFFFATDKILTGMLFVVKTGLPFAFLLSCVTVIVLGVIAIVNFGGH